MGRTPDAQALRAALDAQLPPPARQAVARVAAAGPPAYAVGGAVRDLILGMPVVDVDLAIDGDAAAVARAAAGEARVTAHSRFGTASFRAGPTRIDVARTRSETYARPGALPKVAPADIETDLGRRDFTVNALALRLDGAAALLDPCGGLRDIDARLIRVMHDASFGDDATRIFRAHRYAARLEFTIEPHTAALLRDGVRHVATLSGDRVRREIELMLGERAASAALEACAADGVLSAVHPALRWDAAWSAGLDDLTSAAPRVELGLALLASAAADSDVDAIVVRLRLRRAQAVAVHGVAPLRAHARTLARRDAKPSGIVMVLDRYPPASVAALAATADDDVVRAVCRRYLDEWRHVKPRLKARDLLALGVPQGPEMSKGLQLIRAARLDGWADDEGDERALALRFAKSIRDAGAMHGEIRLHANGH